MKRVKQNNHTDTSVYLLLFLALIKVIIHLATNHQYGYHRDEFYYIICGLQWQAGYVDHPPLVPWIAGLMHSLVESFSLLRLIPALLGGGIVLFTGLFTKRLGGSLFAQAAAALAVITAPALLLSNSIYQTVSFDQFFWLLICYLLLKLILSDHPQFWPAIGIAAGAALMAKYTVLILILSIAIAMVSERKFSLLRSKWLLGGIAAAIILILPNLYWQVSNHFPTWDFIAGIGSREDNSPLQFILLQFGMAGAAALPVFAAGFIFYFKKRNKKVRIFGWVIVSALLLFLIPGGKPYYYVSVYSLLFAGGAVLIDRFLSSLKREFWKPGFIIFMLLANIWVYQYFLPVLPPDELSNHQNLIMHDDFDNMIGWEEITNSISGIYNRLPADIRGETEILTTNYGLASALIVLRKNLSLHNVVSGHNSYALWNQNPKLDPVLCIGFSVSTMEKYYSSVIIKGVTPSPFGIQHEDTGRRMLFCSGLKIPSKTLWQKLKTIN